MHIDDEWSHRGPGPGVVVYLLRGDGEGPDTAPRALPGTATFGAAPGRAWSTPPSAENPSGGPSGASASASAQTPASTPAAAPAPAPSSSTCVASPTTVPGDLGLSVPMSRPSCDGHGAVILYNATTAGQYAQEISGALAAHPGASNLRTDQSCSSLRPRDSAGNVIYVIYVVYRLSGTSHAELCRDVAASGGGYGKWLDTTTDPNQIVAC